MLSRLKYKTQLMTRVGLLLLMPVLLSGAALSQYGINHLPSSRSVVEPRNEPVRTAKTSASTKASLRNSSFTNQPLGSTSPQAAFPVGWTALANTTATGNSIEKTSGVDQAEDGGARSTNAITTGNGYVEFQLTAPGKAISVGLNSGRLAFYPFDMEFTLSAIGGGLNVVEVREAGVYKGDTSYTATDVFRIEISGTDVLYKKNGVTFRTSTNPTFGYPYHADAVLFDLMARAANVTMTAPAGPEGPLPASNFSGITAPTQVSLSWTDNSNDETGFIIERAISVMDQSPRDWVLVVETGPNVTTYVDTGLTPSTQYFYRLRPFNGNGEGRDQSIPVLTPAPTPTPTPTPTPSPTPTPTPFNVTWTARLNTTATGNTIEKTGGQNGNEDARARSTNIIDSGDGYVEFQFTAPGKAVNIGLNSGPQAVTRSDIEFGLSALGGLSIVEVREAGTYRADVSYTSTDVFRIEISGTQVLYKKNGAPFFVNVVPALAYPYLTNAVLLSVGARVANAVMSTPALTVGPLPPSNFTAAAVSSSQIGLSWADNSTDELGFILERARSLPEGGLSDWLPVVTTNQNVTTHSDTGLTPSTIYNYRLRSFNNDGDSIDVHVSNVATPGPLPTFDVEWNGLVNTTATGNSIEKTGGTLADDARARSLNTIFSGNGFVECQFPAPGLITVGLNSGAQAVNRSDIEFALSTIGSFNIVEIREGGVYKGETSYTATDVLRIEISGNLVLYKKNGVTFQATANPNRTYPFHGDAVLVTPGVRAASAKMSTPARTPQLMMSENNPSHAAAVDSVTFIPGPFPLTNHFNFGTDPRTRVMLFAVNFDLLPGEDFRNVVTAQLTNQQGTVFNLPVEVVGKVPGFDWLSFVVVKLDEQVTTFGNHTISLTLRGVTTNTAIITTRP